MHFNTEGHLSTTALKEQVDDRSESRRLHSNLIQFDLTSDSASIGLGDNITVPVTNDGISAIGTYFGVPSAFLSKIERDEAEWIIQKRMQRQPGELTVRFTDGGVTGAYAPGQHVINPARLVTVAEHVLSDEAVVTGWEMTPEDVYFDVTVPETFGRGIGGDPQATVENYAGSGEPKVGDLTLGGLRFGYDRKRNLAPWVEEFYWRLACTNGMEVQDNSNRVDARLADSVEQVLADLERAAQVAFGRAESRISAYYDLRSVPVENPERVIRRVGRERGLPDRTIARLLDQAPTLEGELTMFDVVNLVTNEANNRAITRFSARRALQGVGGAEVAEHHDRCTHCQQKIG